MKSLGEAYDLTYLIKWKTCFIKCVLSKIDLLVTNNAKNFKVSLNAETGLSDCE